MFVNKYLPKTTTPSKKCVYNTIWNLTFIYICSVCLLVLKLPPGEYATNAFCSK